MIRTGSLLLLVAAVVAGCRREDASQDDVPVNAPFALELPVGAPAMEVPAENPLTVAGVELGKKLFFDERLSRPVGTSCASCHLPDHAFSDTTGLSIGSTLLTGMRNSPTLGNVAFHRRLFRDGGVPNLEMQVLAPLHDEKEMDSNINEVAEALRDEPAYDQLSQRAYGRRLDPWVITRAIASYEGLQLFNSAALNCVACHGGFDLSEHDFHNVGTAMDYGSDPGRQRITLLAADEGKFKVPTLRNVALTAPYMHDGSMTTLGEVIDHFASGGLPHPNRSELMQPFTLTTGEKAALIAFLRSLTDERSLDQVP
jgi:cytochrome c peroxidase